MAHGTGYYWNRVYKADIKNDEYAVIFFRTYYYYHPQMSDCYEPDYEALDDYKVSVIKWRKDRWGNEVADCISESVESGTISKDEANKIWWNLKNNNISFERVKEYFDR